MNEEIREYIDYLLTFGRVQKPKMPKFDLSAYNDNEYIFALQDIMYDYDAVDDLYLTLEYLQGD